MLLLTRVIGQRVHSSDGREVGRLADLSVRLHTEQPIVGHLVVTRRGARPLLLPGSVAVVESGRVALVPEVGELSRFEVAAVPDALAADEILLKRDVLDTQIVDVVGQRLARVADVLLVRTAGGGLEALGVEVGFGAVLRRLRFGGRGVGDDVVAWSDLHLTSDRGHLVQLATPRAAVHRLDARGLAALVSRVDTDAASQILAAKEPAVAAEAVRTAHPDIGERVLRAMPEHQRSRIVDAMPTERAGRWRQRLGRGSLLQRRFLRSPVAARRHLNWPHR